MNQQINKPTNKLAEKNKTKFFNHQSYLTTSKTEWKML